MPIYDLQKRARELGRIRIGQKSVNAKGKTIPVKLDRFRFTSHSKHLIEKIADLYGGEVTPWTPKPNAPQQWEAITDAQRIPIMVPPQPVTQWLELWSGGGCVHRCDGITEVISGEPCDLGPDHQAAKPTTRLNVVLPDVEGVGVFRLESHGWNAAVELPDVAAFLERAGGYVDAWLGLEERVSISNGETKRFIVPIIDIDVTPRQLLAGRVSHLELGATSQQAALEAPRAAPNYEGEATLAVSLEEVRAIWHAAQDAGHLTDELKASLTRIGQKFNPSPPPIEQDLNPDAVWQEILGAAGIEGMSLQDVVEDFPKHSGGVTADNASGQEMQQYLDYLRGGRQT